MFSSTFYKYVSMSLVGFGVAGFWARSYFGEDGIFLCLFEEILFLNISYVFDGFGGREVEWCKRRNVRI